MKSMILLLRHYEIIVPLSKLSTLVKHSYIIELSKCYGSMVVPCTIFSLLCFLRCKNANQGNFENGYSQSDQEKYPNYSNSFNMLNICFFFFIKKRGESDSLLL